jgi:hypothetical protein
VANFVHAFHKYSHLKSLLRHCAAPWRELGLSILWINRSHAEIGPAFVKHLDSDGTTWLGAFNHRSNRLSFAGYPTLFSAVHFRGEPEDRVSSEQGGAMQ